MATKLSLERLESGIATVDCADGPASAGHGAQRERVSHLENRGLLLQIREGRECLSLNQSGAKVLALKRDLNDWIEAAKPQGLRLLSEDDNFDQATCLAVKAFQARSALDLETGALKKGSTTHHLLEDGIVGPRTMRALDLYFHRSEVLSFAEFKSITGGYWDISQVQGGDTRKISDLTVVRKAVWQSGILNLDLSPPNERGRERAPAPVLSTQVVSADGIEEALNDALQHNPYRGRRHKCGSYAVFLVDQVFGKGTGARANEDRSLKGEDMRVLDQRIKAHEFPVGTIFWVYRQSPESLNAGRDSSRFVSKGKPHYFVLVGYDERGTPLFSDQYAKRKNGYIYHGLSEVPRAKNENFLLGGVRAPSRAAQLNVRSASALGTDKAA